MSSYFRHAFAALKEANLVLIVVDARFPGIMRVSDMENWLKRKGIPFIIVLNKMDLLRGKNPNSVALDHFTAPFALVSSIPKRNMSKLKGLIFSKLSDGGNVAVVGYPNAGKSSLINALSGRHAAPTSRQAGFTKGRSRIRLKENVYLLDTPGVIPLNEKDPFTLVLFGAKSPNQLRDIQGFAIQLLDWLPSQDFWNDWLQRSYHFQPTGEGEEQLEQLAAHWKKFRKGGIPDLQSAAFKLLMDWQMGVKQSPKK